MIRAMPDLPSGEWSHLLIGHQWPDSAALSILGAAATERAALGSAYDGYADALNAVRTRTLATQEGVTADSTHQLFRSGELTARDIAARNLAKEASYTLAHRWVTDLRADLEAIAASGNSAIRRILDSEDPVPLKVSALVMAVTEAQQHANTRAAACCSNVCDGIQTILTAGDARMSARALARSHGVELEHAFGSPNTELVHAAVSTMIATSGTAPSSESLAKSFTDGTYAGTPLAAGAEALTTGAVNALDTANSNSATESLAVSTGVAPSAESMGTVAPPLLAAPSVVPAAEPNQAVVTLMPISPGAVSSASTALATPPGPLPRYGADVRPPLKVGASAPAVTAAGAPVSAPATAAPALAHSSVVRQQPAAVVANAITATTIGALAGSGAARSAAVSRLRRLLDAMARQEPRLRWAIGDWEDGSTVALTDLAGGWIPAHIDIPVGVQLLEPGHRDGDLTALLGEAVVFETYQPGRDTVSAEGGETVPMSLRARHTNAVDDLGWELIQATRWRDGLPRLAHTLARATFSHTGCLDSEIALLRDELDAAAGTVLDSYPGAVSGGELGNWQLLSAVEAFIGSDMLLANYHLTWFLAHTERRDPEDPR